MADLTPQKLTALSNRLTRLERRAGFQRSLPYPAPACSPDDLRVTMAILWESGGFAPMPGEAIPPQRWHVVNGRREPVEDGFALKRFGQWLREQCGVSEEELGGRDWMSGVWCGEAACQRVLGLTRPGGP